MSTTALVALVPPTDPVLRTPARDVVDFTSEVMPHLDAMRELMGAKNGVGLAAPQVGIPLRFFVTNLPGLKLLINPRIVTAWGGRTTKPEGCLTWPGRTTYVARHDGIRVEWTGRDGQLSAANVSGFHARVIQHEADHLNGICIFP